MGIAIIWVMLLHGSELYDQVHIPVITALAQRGNIGVDIFLFLSGFGLWYSFSKNPDTISFFRKRIKRVVIPYAVLALPLWIYNTIFVSEKHTVWMFLSNFFGISFLTDGVVTTWYVFLILALYLVFPLIFRALDRSGWRSACGMSIITIVCCLALARWTPVFYENVEIAITRIPAFLLGSVAARAQQRREREDSVFLAVYSVLSVVVFALSLAVHSHSRELSVFFYRLGSIGIALIVMVAACLFFELLKKTCYPVLKFLGSITLELYLLHIFLRSILRTNQIGTQSSPEVQVLIWVLTMALAVILSAGFQRCYQKFSKKEKAK